MIISKSQREIDKMAAAGAIHVEVLQRLADLIEPGVTTGELDVAAERMIRERGGTPTFKGYQGFPKSICTSPDDMVVHGIPGAHRLDEGTVLSIDLGVTFDGWIADGAVTFPVGEVSPVAEHLIAVTRRSLFDAVAQCQVGNRLGDVSHAVQTAVEAGGLSVVRTLVGHGVGQAMHEDPQIPNFGPPGRGPRLQPGMVLAVEPMTTVGRPGVVEGDDGWSIYSADGSLAAHFEFTIAITESGPRILTPWHEGPRAL